MAREHRPRLRVDELPRAERNGLRVDGRIERLERVASTTTTTRLGAAGGPPTTATATATATPAQPQLQRRDASRLQPAEIERPRGDGMLDGDGVVKVDDGADGPEGGLLLKQSLAERLVGLGEFLGGKAALGLEGVAVQSDARVRLRIWVSGKAGEG